jgi:hypothetical protein
MLNSACPLPQSIVCGAKRPARNACLPETLSQKNNPREVCGGKRAGRHAPGRIPPAYRLVLLAWFCALTVTGWAQISPGPLSRAHQSLSGATQCTSCHKLAAGAASFKCLECHSDIAGRMAAKRGLHASFGAVSTSQKECATCQPSTMARTSP